jgi:hypothetical protein
MDNQASSRQHAQLRQVWPQTVATLEATFFQDPEWAITNAQGHNDAGYLLWALTQYNSKVARILQRERYTTAELDLAASREVTYQWMHGRKFNRPAAALATCLLNLPSERPEKLQQARLILQRRSGALPNTTPPPSRAPSTETPLLSHGLTHKTQGPVLVGSVLQELMPPSYAQLHSQEPPPQGYISKHYAPAPR